jgi:hypothetical protein
VKTHIIKKMEKGITTMSEVNALQSLMSSISSTQKLIKKADNALNFKNADITLKTLQTTIDQLEDFLTASKSNRKFSKQKKPTIYLINTIRSLKYAVSNREINVPTFCKEVRTDVFDRLQDLQAAAYNQIEKYNEDPEAALEKVSSEVTENDCDFSNAQYEYVNNKLSAYTKLISNSLVSKIKNEKLDISRDAVLPVELPITVSFENVALRNTKILRNVFKTVEPLGLAAADSSDIALILTKQTILQFSRTSAEEIAHNIVDNDPIANKLKLAKINLKSERSKLRKLKSEIEKIENLLLSYKRIGTLTKVKKLELTEQLSLKQSELDRQDSNIGKAIKRVSESKSLHQSRVRALEKKSSNVYYTRVTEFLEQLRERGHEYSLMSSEFLTSPKNNDIALAWVVPSSVYRNLYSQTKGNVKVLSWGLPLGGRNVKNKNRK